MAFKKDDIIIIEPKEMFVGNIDAPVTLMEFGEYESEECAKVNEVVKQLLAEYEGKIKLVIRYMPFHGNSKLAAVMLEEARDQGKFEAALDILFEKQPEWADHARPRPELLPEFLSAVGVDKAKLKSSELLSKHSWKVDLDQSDGAKLGVRLTPTFFVNGKMLHEIGYAPIKQAIEDALRK